MKSYPALFILLLCFAACRVNRNFDPAKKYPPSVLQSDYKIFRSVLEESHPSLYWYIPKDSVDLYFAQGASKLHDSLPEYKFRLVLSYVLAKIHCGHTSVRASKEATAYAQRVRSMSFPLSVKAWNDTVAITSNLSRRDSSVNRGSVLTAVDGRPIHEIVDSFFSLLSSDGYNITHKYQTISNPGVFRGMYAAVYGLRPGIPINFTDSAGNKHSATIGLYMPPVDSARRPRQQPTLPSTKERKNLSRDAVRNMVIDSSLHTAFIEVNSFTTHTRTKPFLRKSFRTIRKQNIHSLVVDLRGNGGGNVTLSNLFTKYIADKPFHIADSLYAVSNRSKYGKYQSSYFFNRLFFLFLTHKERDQNYHFKYFEGKYFKPKRKNHFKGTTYILTGGNTFSAAVLFTKALVKQEDVIVVGEETGGGSYGNTAWLIPDITLPHTHVRFRLPLFRLVIDSSAPKGRGVMPEVEVLPTLDAIRHNSDYKMDAVRKLIQEAARR